MHSSLVRVFGIELPTQRSSWFLPQAVATMMDPATSGPAFIALPQISKPWPTIIRMYFEEKFIEALGLGPISDSIAEAAEILKSAEKPMIVAGGGGYFTQTQLPP